MNKRIQSVLLASLVASMGGCSLVKVKGLGSSPASTTAASGGTASADDAKPATGPGPAPSKGAKYIAENLTYTQVRRGFSAHKTFYDAGAAQNDDPRKGGNPDPAWIPTWPLQGSEEDVEAIIAQAAVNRTWTAAASAHFDAWWGKLSPRLQRNQTAIDGIVGSAASTYEKLSQLEQVWTDTVAADPDFAKRDYAPTLQLPLMNAAHDVLGAHKASYATRRFSDQLGVTGDFQRDAIQVATAAEARAVFLLRAMEGSYHFEDSLKFPQLYTAEDLTYGGNVRWPLSKDERAATEAAVKTAQAANEALLAYDASTRAFSETQVGDSRYQNGRSDQDSKAEGLTSTKVERVKGNVVYAVRADKKSTPYNCKTVWGTNGGVPGWVQDCKFKSSQIDHVFELRAPSWPVELKKGDVLEFQGTVTAFTATKAKVDVTLEDVYIYAVERDNKPVWRTFPKY